jgi:hypothetical protein
MADLLFAVAPETGEGARSLYFADEVPGAANDLRVSGGKSADKPDAKPGPKPS